nr:MAG TPA: hypothetical protein [Crassvirales sp.]
MKFLDLNGLKHLLGKIVKYDKGTTNISNIFNLTAANKIKALVIQSKDADVAHSYISFPSVNTMYFTGGKISLAMEANKMGLHLKKHPLLESIYPEEAETLENQDLFIIIADILATLKKKGIME